MPSDLGPVRSDWDWICRLRCWVLTESRIGCVHGACCAHSGSASTGRVGPGSRPPRPAPRDTGALEELWRAGSGRVGRPLALGYLILQAQEEAWGGALRPRGGSRKGSCAHPRPCTPRPGDSAALSAGSKESLFSLRPHGPARRPWRCWRRWSCRLPAGCVYYVSKVPRHVRLGLGAQPSSPRPGP